jgi:hypothetical protein
LRAEWGEARGTYPGSSYLSCARSSSKT